MRMKHMLPLMLVVALAGCAPYALAVKETYEVATDPRSLATQATDTQAEVQIKAALLASPVSGTSGIDVYCRQGVVVLVGVVPPGSQAGQAAVSIARQTSGVKRVETYFVPSRPSWESDIAIKEQIRASSSRTPPWYQAGSTSPSSRGTSCSSGSSTHGRMFSGSFQTHDRFLVSCP